MNKFTSEGEQLPDFVEESLKDEGQESDDADQQTDKKYASEGESPPQAILDRLKDEDEYDSEEESSFSETRKQLDEYFSENWSDLVSMVVAKIKVESKKGNYDQYFVENAKTIAEDIVGETYKDIAKLIEKGGGVDFKKDNPAYYVSIALSNELTDRHRKQSKAELSGGMDISPKKVDDSFSSKFPMEESSQYLQSVAKQVYNYVFERESLSGQEFGDSTNREKTQQRIDDMAKVIALDFKGNSDKDILKKFLDPDDDTFSESLKEGVRDRYPDLVNEDNKPVDLEPITNNKSEGGEKVYNEDLKKALDWLAQNKRRFRNRMKEELGFDDVSL